MAQQLGVEDQAARPGGVQNMSHSTSTPSADPSDPRQLHLRRRRLVGPPVASPPSPAVLDCSLELTAGGHACPMESWVEVASQPSSSSLSSIGDEIVTAGLQVANPYQYHRRRRTHPPRSVPRQQTAPPTSGTSSQEEYEESDSEEDRVLASSAENILHSPSSAEEAGVDSDDGDGDGDGEDDGEDDGDDATALGHAATNQGDKPAFQPFQPSPNAFSHPAAARLGQRSHSIDAGSMAPHPHSGFARRSFPGRSHARAQRGPSFMSPSVREDNDAALRASLTTLLSCAAAARGLPKTEGQRPVASNGVGPSSQPIDLHLVPETELMKEREESRAPAPSSRERAERTSPTRPSNSPQGGTLEQARPAAPESRSPRATKKKRASASAAASPSAVQAVVADEPLISPTLLTWVVSAGVVVLVSVVGFGAGYVIGREVGRQESLAASISGGFNDTASSGQEVIRSSGNGLRRFRWGAVGRSIVAAA